MIKDAMTGESIQNAIIHVTNITSYRRSDIKHDITSVRAGDYYRLLTPGSYIISIYKAGYLTARKKVIVRDSGHHEAQTIDFELVPLADVRNKLAKQIHQFSGYRSLPKI